MGNERGDLRSFNGGKNKMDLKVVSLKSAVFLQTLSKPQMMIFSEAIPMCGSHETREIA